MWYYLDTYTDTHTHTHPPWSTARNTLILFIGILLFWRQKVREIGKKIWRTYSKIYNWIMLITTAISFAFLSYVIPMLFCRVSILKGGYWRLRRIGLSLTCRKATLECLFHFENINTKEILFDVQEDTVYEGWLCAKKPGKIIFKWIILCYLFSLCFHIYAPYQQ